MDNTQAIQDILVIVQHIQDNSATKDDIANMATKDDIAKIYEVMATKDDIAKIYNVMATKDDIRELRNEMFEHVDAFISLNRKQTSEIAAISMRQNRTERKLDLVIKKSKLKLA